MLRRATAVAILCLLSSCADATREEGVALNDSSSGYEVGPGPPTTR